MQGKAVIVTGAFGALGKVVANAFADRGAKVTLVDKAPAPTSVDLTGEALVLGGVDLTKADEARGVVEQTLARFGGLDVLVNVAGGFRWETVAEGDPATWDLLYHLNVVTAANMSRAAIRALSASSAGRIVNVGAGGAVKAAAGMGAYAASKAGVHRLTEALAEELKGKVNVNAVLPSIIDTPQNRADMPKADFSAWVSPHDLAAVILFLASDDARAVTGALVPVNGRVEPLPPLLSIWAVADGRAGIEGQVVGLAEAVARLRPAQVSVKQIRWRGLAAALPARLNPAPRAWTTDPEAIAPPWPDLWIAAGRASLPLSIRVRRWSGGRTFVAQVQDPRLPPRLFDLVIPPRHDGLAGPNIVSILGAPHRVTSEALARARADFAARLEPLPRPRVAALIGGRSKAHDLSPTRAQAMARDIAAAVEAAGGSLMLTFSRRTPPGAKAAFRAEFGALPGQIWDGEGPNPYFGFLAFADHILVTEDSANMATEAAASGAPVQVLAMDGHSRKLAAFHGELQSYGASRPFAGRLESWSYEPLAETDRAARAVIEAMERR
jgi:mitochondrial fission protein ELM1/NAD(P)-dependent dehydrogenase (short-subunit alcohol dehydrogenase family)